MTLLDPLHSSMQAEIEALRARCAEYEKLLERAVYPTAEEAVKLQVVWPLSTNQASILVAMWRAGKRPLTTARIDDVALVQNPTIRSDPDYRSPSCVSVWIYHLRLMFGKPAILHRYGMGYWLSPEMWSRLNDVLA